MKILFIFPNFDCPLGLSIGISYLCGALKQKGYQTKVIHITEFLNYSFDIDRIVDDAQCFDPDLIAFSFGTNHYPEVSELSKQLKNITGKKILFGGVHTTLNAQTVMEQNPWVDYANVGEGDDSFIELVDALDKGLETTAILNIWSRTSEGIIKNRNRPLKKLKGLPFMDLDVWDFETITLSRRGWVNISMNRGCPYRCTYCHNNGLARVLQENLGTRTSSNADLGYLQLRDIDEMIDELKEIVFKYPFVKAFSFIDDTFTMDEIHCKAFLKKYKQEVGLPFVCNTTVIDVDDDMLLALKEANCDLVRFGVETASSRIKRDILKRDFSQTKTEKVFQFCAKISAASPIISSRIPQKPLMKCWTR